MKKLFSIFLILLTVSSGLVFAETSPDPFDKLAEKLLKDFDDKGSSVAVKIFTANLSSAERKKISKSVQFALFCTDEVEIVAKVAEADYICTGTIEEDGPNYIVSAKLTDAYDGSEIAKARQKISKDYYQEGAEVQTVVVENEIDAGDVLGAVIVGSVIGGVFHSLTTPPPPAPRPRKAPKPAPRPRRP